MTPPRSAVKASPARIRCAIYTRKSTDEGLDQAFNSLDAQREAAEKFICSREGEGWVALPERYDDGGFSGGNTQRPALQRLLDAIRAGCLDQVVVYRQDRLSRRMLDFLKLLELFDRHAVSLTSVTEPIDTSSPGGRMFQNTLLNFAQYEREVIAERTRHKVQAARRRGQFIGGFLPLGYDRHPEGGRLVINETEAKRARQIFRLFLKQPSLIVTVQELNHRGWTLKRWTTKEGRQFGGGTFDKHSLRRLLTNPVYVGRVRFEDRLYNGEQQAIVDQKTWDRVQELLTDGACGSRGRRTRSNALLAGILRCVSCDSAMTPTYSQKKNVRFRYYLCNRAHRRGHATCPSPMIPAPEIEKFVVERIRAIGQDEQLVARTIEQAEEQLTAKKNELEAEVRKLKKRLERAHTDMRKGLEAVTGSKPTPPDAKAAKRIQKIEEGLTAAHDELSRLRARKINPADLRAALGAFDPLWANLTTTEQAQVVQLLIERIDYNGDAGKMAITFRPTGVQTLAKEATK